MTMIAEDYMKQTGPFEPMTSEPFGVHRCDPDIVRDKPHSYTFKECDTCGREFAYETFKHFSYRNCCALCSEIWDKYSNLRSSDKKQRLYFYRVKAFRDLGDVLDNEIEYKSFSVLELDILGMLQNGEKSAVGYAGNTITDICEKLFGREYIKSGAIKGYSEVFKACKKLINKGLVRKYTAVARGLGRPPVKYKLARKVYVVKKKCPNCGNNKYWIDKDDRTFNCIYCGARWVIPK